MKDLHISIVEEIECILQNVALEDKKINNCSICVSSKKGKLWGDPQQLQIDIDSGITIGHPSVLESEDNFVLVFSANMSGLWR